mmetsp:Transcript_32348/g.52109  ORF Transcript_32348/g.52109 Transcript_32348/m.52109 type:complete len:209 (-) Transcript_32348:22-648(-)
MHAVVVGHQCHRRRHVAVEELESSIVDIIAHEMPAVDTLYFARSFREAHHARLHTPTIPVHIPAPQPLEHERSAPLFHLRQPPTRLHLNKPLPVQLPPQMPAVHCLQHEHAQLTHSLFLPSYFTHVLGPVVTDAPHLVTAHDSAPARLDFLGSFEDEPRSALLTAAINSTAALQKAARKRLHCDNRHHHALPLHGRLHCAPACHVHAQ